VTMIAKTAFPSAARPKETKNEMNLTKGRCGDQVRRIAKHPRDGVRFGSECRTRWGGHGKVGDLIVNLPRGKLGRDGYLAGSQFHVIAT
jgi:hypothetical protein